MFNLFIVPILAALWTDAVAMPQTTNAVCRPPPRDGADQYMIGYGSLMETASKSRTAPNTGPSIPVLVHGFSRQWNAQGISTSYSTTYLGVVPDPSATFNAVIFQLPNTANMASDLRAYDEREAWYCRQEVPAVDIDSLVASYTIDPDAQYWIYVNKPEFDIPPNAKYPIAESYVDIFISGCLELGEEYGLPTFAENCVRSTVGWEAPWINDRENPRRAFIHQPNASKIDQVLAAAVPDAYKAIQIEG